MGTQSTTSTSPDPTAATVPGPRDWLDSGSITELATEGRELHLDVVPARPWPTEHHDIVVPDIASNLVDGLGPYGS